MENILETSVVNMENILDTFTVNKEGKEDVIETTPCEFDDFDFSTLSEDDTLSSIEYGEIFHSGYYWEVPYIIDIAEYANAVGRTWLGKHKLQRSITLSAEISPMGYGDELRYTLYSWFNDYEEGKDNHHYDCLTYNDGENIVVNGETKETSFKTFKEKILEILTTIHGCDMNGVQKKLDRHRNEEKDARLKYETLYQITHLNDEIQTVENECCISERCIYNWKNKKIYEESFIGWHNIPRIDWSNVECFTSSEKYGEKPATPLGASDYSASNKEGIRNIIEKTETSKYFDVDDIYSFTKENCPLMMYDHINIDTDDFVVLRLDKNGIMVADKECNVFRSNWKNGEN